MTVTTEGYTPPLEYKGVFLPVKLDIKIGQSRSGLYPPLRRDGELVYALPGGRDVMERDFKKVTVGLELLLVLGSESERDTVTH